MEYTPLLTATMFDGIKGDVMVAANGLLAIALIMVAIGVIYRIFFR